MRESWILPQTDPSKLFQGLFWSSLELERPHAAPSLLQHLSFPSQSFFPLFIQESSLRSAKDHSSLKWGFCCRVKTVEKTVVPSKYPRRCWLREQEHSWPTALYFEGQGTQQASRLQPSPAALHLEASKHVPCAESQGSACPAEPWSCPVTQHGRNRCLGR